MSSVHRLSRKDLAKALRPSCAHQDQQAAHRKTKLLPVEIFCKIMQQPWLSRLLCVLVERIPADAHDHLIDLGGFANAGPATVDAGDCFRQNSLRTPCCLLDDCPIEPTESWCRTLSSRMLCSPPMLFSYIAATCLHGKLFSIEWRLPAYMASVWRS